MARSADCVFCKIVSVEIPASVLYENEQGLAFLDVNPLSEGHILFVPRDHYERLCEMPGDLLSRFVTALPRLGRALIEVTGAEGYNLLVNDGAVAGQVVPHVHFHLIPRRPVDGLGYRWNAGIYSSGRADELAAAYQDALRRLRE